MIVSSLFSEHERRKSVKGTVRARFIRCGVKGDKKGEAISGEAHFLHPPIRNYNFTEDDFVEDTGGSRFKLVADSKHFNTWRN